MRITVGRLRELVAEATVSASGEYMIKERCREALHDLILARVRSGEISTSQDLDGFFGSIDMAAKALMMVPLDVWKKLAAR